MKRFVSRKVIKIERYKLLWVCLVGFLVLLFSINFLTNIVVKKIASEKIQNFFTVNTFGEALRGSDNLWYKSIWGWDLKKEEPVFNNTNLNSLIDNPIVYIYNTFQTDKYKNNYYNSYNINPVITQASLILQELLKKEGINSLVEESSVAKVLSDNEIPYTNSYKGSRILMEKAKSNNNSLKYFLDMQLSDYEKSVTTVDIDGVSYAKILFVVGTDNFNYGENQVFANKLNEILERENKLLTRGVSLRGGSGYQGVYNQDYSSRVLLIQVGGKENTIDEVNRTLMVLAKVIKEYVREDI